MQSTDERLVNNWLEQPVKSNNGILYQEHNGDEVLEYTYSDYCEDFYFKIKSKLIKNGNTILHEEEFKDRVIYLLYKYSKHELYGCNER